MVSTKRLIKLARPSYRHAYLKEMVTGWVINQIKALRDQRDWSQTDLGERAGKPQSAIARLESESYGNWNTNTLLEIAQAFDVALQIRFVSWPRFISETEDTSPEKMAVRSFSRIDFLLMSLNSGLRDQSANHIVGATTSGKDTTVFLQSPSRRDHNSNSFYNSYSNAVTQ